MTLPATIEAAEAYWASQFGCRVEDFNSSRNTVVQHVASFEGYQGVFLFRRGLSCILSAPPAFVEDIATSVLQRKPEEVFNPAFLAKVFGNSLEKIVGPAWLGYADKTDFRPTETREAHLLDQQDNDALHRLARACNKTEWEYSAIEFDRPPILGCFVEGEIVAAAGYEVWGERLAHVGVITHPSHRGRGYGKAVVSAITEYGLSKGLIMQYRTLESNTPSVAIARSLGYQNYATTIAVRLTFGASK